METKKEIIDYSQMPIAISDYLIEKGISLEKDFTEKQREKFKRVLEEYMRGEATSSLIMDLGKITVSLLGEDEAGYLYYAMQQ